MLAVPHGRGQNSAPVQNKQRFASRIMALPRLAVEMLASICLTRHD